MSTLLMLRRIEKLEGRILPRLSPAEQLLCGDPAFRRLVTALGFDFDALRQRGSVLQALPRDLLKALVERLKATVPAQGTAMPTAMQTERECSE